MGEKRAILKLTPYAFSKLRWMQQRGKTEVAGWGIGSEDDLLLIEDFVLVKQVAAMASFEMTKEGLQEYYAAMLGKGLPMGRISRVMFHTHPMASPEPSSTDEENFEDLFANADWGVMAIIGSEGNTYARLRCGFPQPTDMKIGWQMIYTRSYGWGQEVVAGWEEEYNRCIQEKTYSRGIGARSTFERDYDDLFKEKIGDGPRIWTPDMPLESEQPAKEVRPEKVAKEVEQDKAAPSFPVERGQLRTIKVPCWCTTETPTQDALYIYQASRYPIRLFKKTRPVDKLTADAWADPVKDYWPMPETSVLGSGPVPTVVDGFIWEAGKQLWVRNNLTDKVVEVALTDLHNTLTETFFMSWDKEDLPDETSKESPRMWGNQGKKGKRT